MTDLWRMAVAVGTVSCALALFASQQGKMPRAGYCGTHGRNDRSDRRLPYRGREAGARMTTSGVERIQAQRRLHQVEHMAGDGNCLFRALAHPHGDHQVVRARVVQHLRMHWDDTYHAFVPEEKRGTYLNTLAREGVWGDELVLRGFADAADMRVDVFRASDPSRLISTYGSGRVADRKLLYDGVHYNVLVT